jgi:hypothetical protein
LIPIFGIWSAVNRWAIPVQVNNMPKQSKRKLDWPSDDTPDFVETATPHRIPEIGDAVGAGISETSHGTTPHNELTPDECRSILDTPF